MHLSNVANTYDNRLGVRVYLRAKYNAEAALGQLLEQREAIEAEIGEKLEWDPNPDARDKVIRIHRPIVLENKDDWPEHLAWMVDMTGKFRKAFGPRVKKLDLDADPTSESEDQ